MAEWLVDTDLFVDHFRGARPLDISSGRVSYSIVTRAELFAGRGADEDGLRILLGRFRELQLSRHSAERAGQIRREIGVALPDALIAATALEHDLALQTRNRRDFERVPGLALAEDGT
jgi:predicted nucleic acid-binding protein